MMNSIVEENRISFKELEQKIFAYVCELGREITRIMLESYDRELAEGRDKKAYRGKGSRRTTIKTVYGEVEYRRRVYQTKTENGQIAHVFLLDQAMRMDKIGLISTNLAEKIALTVTESPYRTTADIISQTCGQSISAQGVWNMMQRLGERIDEEEMHAVKQMEAEQTEGTRPLPVLFEEMDGVWLSMQDEHHKKMKKQEMKVFTMYEGWDAEKEKEGRSTLVGKTMLAGMEESRTVHEKREACIRRKYDADEIGQRILNGDGGELDQGAIRSGCDLPAGPVPYLSGSAAEDKRQKGTAGHPDAAGRRKDRRDAGIYQDLCRQCGKFGRWGKEGKKGKGAAEISGKEQRGTAAL